MLKHRYIDYICIGILCIAVIITLIFINGRRFGIVPAHSVPEYVNRLFDDSRVHTIDLQVEDWGGFIENAPEEQYVSCNVVIDGERFYQVGLRSKGNNSRSLTEEYALSRYSLKLEFDHYQYGMSYHGLDKFSLDSSFQDNSYMKTYLSYNMMKFMGVTSPLCSYANVTVNGKPWGLFLAIEEPEEAFARRCFGNNYGKLYKPDYKSLKDENADIALKYIDDSFESYNNIFTRAKFSTTDADKKRLINALKILSTGENLETAVNVDMTLRYFAVQVFVINPDSYLGHTGHNYFLHEKDGVISILPWDYNLSFGTYCLGMTNPITDPNEIINYPMDTPWSGDVIVNRPLYHNLMQNNEYFSNYHKYMNMFIQDYFNSGKYEVTIRKTMKMLDPYIKQDATAFCTYEDYLLAAETLIQICDLRSESIRGQLSGEYPSTFKEQDEYDIIGIDASDIHIENLGDFDDLENAKDRQDAALANVIGAKN